MENSDITANSVDFRGGNVIITAQGIVGTEFRDQLTPKSDITATGVSPEFSGNVQINQLTTDPSQGLIDITTSVIDAENQLSQGCKSSSISNNQNGKFTIIGRGGLPSNPDDLLTAIDPVVDLGELVSIPAKQPSINSDKISEIIPNPIMEAQGWIKDDQGHIYLVAQISHPVPQSPILPKNSCSLP